MEARLFVYAIENPALKITEIETCIVDGDYPDRSKNKTRNNPGLGIVAR